MAKKKNGTQTADSLPNKPHFYVSEVADYLSQKTGREPSGIRSWMYRQIENGKVKAIRLGGILMLEQAEASRILKGETP